MTNKYNKKRPKIICEVCGEDNKDVLQRHHIIGRKEFGTSNHDFNIAILCSNCHLKTHAGRLRIIGVFPGTRPPTGRILVYELDGKKIFDVDEAYFKYKPPGMSYKNNP